MAAMSEILAMRILVVGKVENRWFYSELRSCVFVINESVLGVTTVGDAHESRVGGRSPLKATGRIRPERGCVGSLLTVWVCLERCRLPGSLCGGQ